MPNKITALLQAPPDSKCEARECAKTDRHVFSPDAFFLHKPSHPAQKPLLPTFQIFLHRSEFHSLCCIRYFISFNKMLYINPISIKLGKRDGMRRKEGGGFRMGNTCIPVADSF